MSEHRVSGQVLELVKFIDAVDGAAGTLAKVMELGTPLDYHHYKEIRVTGKQEDYKYPCCNSPYGEPTIYDASKYTYSVGGELGYIGKKTIGASLVLNFIPVTKPIEKWTHIGARIDSVLQKYGGGCQLRALIEGNVNVGLSKWAPAAPCEKCPIEMNASGSVLGGGGVQCTMGPAPSQKQNNLVQASLQGWGKISPLGFAQLCTTEGKWSRPNLDFCVQYRIRYYDWLDIEGQQCWTAWNDIAGTFGY